MAILVTGGAGFIARHLIELLLARGHDVVAVDSLWTGSMENLEELAQNPRFRYIIHDVRDPLPEVDNLESVYHLACPASPDHFEVSPVDIMETAFLGTRHAFQLALRKNARVLIASTSEIYGDPLVATQKETYLGNVNSFGPRACYDEGKRASEALAYSYRLQYKLDVRVARIFNAYGPFMQLNDGRAVPNFIAAAMEGKPLTIYGDGASTRCFQFATDCARGLMALMESDYLEPVNIGSDNETSVRDIGVIISSLVAEKIGRQPPVPIRFLPKRVDDPLRRKPDISVARDALGWEPKVKLDEGIAATIDWFLGRRTSATGDASAVKVEL